MSIKKLRVNPFPATTLVWWKTRRNKIDMEPTYQRRGRLWSDTDKAYLIDSILNGFDVPKLYLADFTFTDSALNKKKLPYAIIDGKQRFEAIFDFFDGKIVLNKDFIYHEKPSLSLGGLGYRDLVQNHTEIAEVFDNHNLSVMSVITDSEDLINELFVRLNRSKPLTGAEIRNAMAGPAPGVIRELAKQDFFKSCIAFPISRGQDLNAAAKILMFEFYEEPGETKRNNLDTFVRGSAKNKTQLELSGRRAYASLEDLASIFLPHDKLLASAGIMPVYYWFVRSISSKNYPHVRDFLVNFEDKRKENRALEDMNEYNQDFLAYDQYNRSTNDLHSHTERINTLNKYFEKYLRRRK